MAPDPIPEQRITRLNDRPVKKGEYVLYWMQAAQRVEENPALAHAVELANGLERPLLVLFALTAYPEGNLRHYWFMLQGLRETQSALADRGIRLAVVPGAPPEAVPAAAQKAATVVCDAGYTRIQRSWRDAVAERCGCRVVRVEGEVVVPVATASPKAEYAARTIRPKIGRLMERFLTPVAAPPAAARDPDLGPEGIDLADPETALAALEIDRSVGPVHRFFTGGTSAAKARFTAFLDDSLERYPANRNQPQTDDVSRMSPYLHFGQISPVWLARTVRTRAGDLPEAVDAYLEELVVRRELAVNHVWYTRGYDRFEALPGWARGTLADHRGDPREPCYSLDRLEAADTHDPYWNAAMTEMKATGFMHNYMRMYWGKKVLEWSSSPEAAFRDLLTLNNRYFLDGRDPNSHAGVGWIFGLHDRPWKERPIFGKTRYMAASGLERKCDIQGYVEKVARLSGADAAGG